MEIIEQFVCSGDASSFCEDKIVVDDNFVAVLDGVTSRDSQSLQEGKSGGLWAVDVLAQAIQDSPPALSAEAMIASLSAALGKEISKTVFAQDVVPPGATAIVFSMHRLELWRVGSPCYLLDGYYYPPKDSYNATMVDARAVLVELMLADGKTEDEMLQSAPDWIALQPWLERQHLLANHPSNRFAYGVINGSPVPSSLLEVYQLRPGQELVMATDGYPRALATLESSEAYREEALLLDPLQFGPHPGWRAGGDDRAYVRLRV